MLPLTNASPCVMICIPLTPKDNGLAMAMAFTLLMAPLMLYFHVKIKYDFYFIKNIKWTATYSTKEISI